MHFSHWPIHLFDDMIGGAEETSIRPESIFRGKILDEHLELIIQASLYMALTHTATQVFFLKYAKSSHQHVCIVQLSLLDSHKIWVLYSHHLFFYEIFAPNWGSEASRNKNVLQINLRSSIGLKNCFWWRFPACERRPCWKVMAGIFWFLLKQPRTLVGGRKVSMFMHHVS